MSSSRLAPTLRSSAECLWESRPSCRATSSFGLPGEPTAPRRTGSGDCSPCCGRPIVSWAGRSRPCTWAGPPASGRCAGTTTAACRSVDGPTREAPATTIHPRSRSGCTGACFCGGYPRRSRNSLIRTCGARGGPSSTTPTPGSRHAGSPLCCRASVAARSAQVRVQVTGSGRRFWGPLRRRYALGSAATMRLRRDDDGSVVGPRWNARRGLLVVRQSAGPAATAVAADGRSIEVTIDRSVRRAMLVGNGDQVVELDVEPTADGATLTGRVPDRVAVHR